MSTAPRTGPIAKTFVAVNRLFGYGALIGGMALLVQVGWSLLRGADFSRAWLPLVFGIGGCLVGWVYIRAPLYRGERRPADEQTPLDSSATNPALPNKSLERTREK